MSFSTVVRQPIRLSRQQALRGMLIFIAALVLLLAGVLAWAVSQRRAANEQAMRENPVRATYSAIEYSIYPLIEERGSSPANAQELLSAGLLSLPRKRLTLNSDPVNPFNGEAIRFIQPGMHFEPGDCLYLPAYRYVTVDNQQMPPTLSYFYLIVFGPTGERPYWYRQLPQELNFDFNLDGRPDDVCYVGGYGMGYPHFSQGYHSSSESLHDVMLRLGYGQYWIETPEK